MNQLYNPPGKVSAIRVKHRQKFLNYKKLFMVLAFLVSAVASKAQFQTAENKRFPIPVITDNIGTLPAGCSVAPDAGRTGMYNIKTDFGAKGDGVTDDTQAFRNAVGKSGQQSRNTFLYIPDGVYLLTDTIGFSPDYVDNGFGLNRWGTGASNIQMWGESRTGVILKLKNGSSRFQDNTRLWALFDTGRESADRFGNSISNVTIEIGANNPAAIGLRQYLNNYGGLYNVTIRALDNSAKIGLDKAYSRANGPSLTKDVKIEGFDIGIKTDYSVESEVYEHVTLIGQKQTAWRNGKQVLSIRDLKVLNCQGPALVNEAGFINILNSNLSGTGSAAIQNGIKGSILALDLTTSGYTNAVADQERPLNGQVNGVKYLSDDGVLPNGNKSSDIEPLNLPVKETPIIDWESDPSKWVNPADFGATGNGICNAYVPCQPCDDDAPAIQRAIDAMNDPNNTQYYGRTHLFLPATYRLYTSVKVYGNVKRIFSLTTGSVGHPGSGKKFDNTTSVDPSWIVESRPGVYNGEVEFYGIVTGAQGFNPPVPVVKSSSGRTIIFKNCAMLPYNGPTIDIAGGEVFIESCSIGNMRFNNVNVWARQNNPEAPNIKVQMIGGTYWGLGLKTEQKEPVIVARNRAKLEIYGAYIYDTHGSRPYTMFDLENSELSVSMFEYVGGYGDEFGTLVKDVKNGQTTLITPGSQNALKYPATWNQCNDNSLKPSQTCTTETGSMFLLYRNTSSSPTAPVENWVLVDDQLTTPGNHTLVYDPSSYSLGWQSWPVGGAFSNTEKGAAGTNGIGAVATFTFTGTKVGLYARKDINWGIAEVTLDNQPPVNVDLYSSTQMLNQLVYQSGNLSATTHTLKVKRLGTNNPQSSGSMISIDGFEYLASSTTTTPVTSITVTSSGGNSIVAGGAGLQLSKTVNPSTANQNVTWSSNNSNVTVSTSGLVTASASATGSVTITATSQGQNSPVSGSINLTISSGGGGGGTYTYLPGSGFYQRTMSTPNQEVTKVPESAIGDNNPSTFKLLDDDSDNLYQAAGLTWTTAQSGISKVEITHGIQLNNGQDNGNFSANIALQYQTSVGGAWQTTAWSLSPTYPYDYRVSDQTYTFQGTALPGVVAIRVVGQVHTNNTSWAISVREIRAYTSGGSTQPPSSTAGVGYHWKNIATASPRSDGTLNVNKFASPAVNDGNTTTSYQQIGDNDDAGLQAVGIVWSSPKTNIDKVNFYQGEITWEGGWFSPSSTQTIRVQYQTTAGGLWTDTGVGFMNQAYAYDASVSNKLYTFNIPRITQGIVGIRIIGPVKTSGDSWAIYYREVEAFASGTKVSSINDANQQLQLNQNTVAEKITVFPNPVTDGWINLGLNAADKNNKVDVLVSDLSGRVVLKNSFTSNGISERLNLSNVQPGVYMIRITGANTKFSSKVIVE